MVAVIAAGDIEQHGVAVFQAARRGADRLHRDAGADIARGAVERARAQAVFTEAGNAQHIFGSGLVEARDAHCAAVEHAGADLAAKPRLADAGAQQHRRDLLDDQLVQLAGAAHAGKLVFALDRAQAGEHIVGALGRKRQVFLQQRQLLQRHRAHGDVSRFGHAGERLRNAAEAAHRADIREKRFPLHAVHGAPHKQHSLIRGHDKRAVRHGAGQIIQVDLIVQNHHGPCRIAFGHGAAQTVQAGRQLIGRNRGMGHCYRPPVVIFCGFSLFYHRFYRRAMHAH